MALASLHFRGQPRGMDSLQVLDNYPDTLDFDSLIALIILYNFLLHGYELGPGQDNKGFPIIAATPVPWHSR